MIKLSDLFHIEYGNQADLNKLEETTPDKGVRFISRSSENLGFQCYVKRNHKLKLYNKGDITVTLGGTYLLSAFVQPDSFYTAQNIKVLTPKEKMSEAEKYFYCYVISQNRFRYSSHGREANKTLDDLPVPSLNELPKWINKAISKVKEPDKKPYHNKKVNLKDRDWDWFELKKIFDIKGSKSHTKEGIKHYSKGDYPFVVTSSVNNGIEGFYDHYTEEGNVLTIDSATIGSCFYQELNFSASDHVEKLIPKFILNRSIAMFLITIINMEQFRYGYGRKFAQIRIEKTKVKLPINKEGKPDWEFMEYYIKSLPYSNNLKEEK